MVGRPEQGTHGCVLQSVQTTLPAARWLEAGFYVGRELRRRYPNGKRTWDARDWAAEHDAVLDVVLEAIRACERMPVPSSVETEPQWTPSAETQANGFVAWRLFRRRHPVSGRPGIYIFGSFDGLPEAVTDPLSRHVIYIGYSGHQKNRRTIAQRLDEFEQTALGDLGHSAGWTYRTEFAKDWESLRQFRNTYVSWKAYDQDTADHPREAERELIAEYRRRWGNWPFLNRTA